MRTRMGSHRNPPRNLRGGRKTRFLEARGRKSNVQNSKFTTILEISVLVLKFELVAFDSQPQEQQLVQITS